MAEINEKEIKRRLEAISSFKTTPEVTARDLERVRQTLTSEQATRPQNIWRIIMKSKITKLAAAAVIIIAILISINIFNGTPAWAIQQTIDALDNIETAIAYCYGSSVGFFKLQVKGNMNDLDSFGAHAESNTRIGVIKNNLYYDYTLETGEIYTYDLENFKGAAIKLWYEAMKNAPWVLPIAPTLFKAAKLVSSDWEEIYKKDEISGRNCVFVTGSYQPLSTSFEVVFDLETKLIVRGKYWTNSNRNGLPSLSVQKIVYNEKIPDEIFDLEKATGAKVIHEEEIKKRWALWRQAIELDRKKQYTEAIKTYQELYEKYPQFEKTPEALVIIAICYREMGQYDKAIQYFQKVPREYSAPRYAICDAHRLLGRCYMSTGEHAKALKAFESCLELIEQWDPEKVKWEKTRELIKKDMEKIKGKN